MSSYNLENLPVPFLRIIQVPKRMPRKWSIDDCSLNCAVSFDPPYNVELWPKKVGDIGKETLSLFLRFGGPDVIGSIAIYISSY